jgi:hypothetical protein
MKTHSAFNLLIIGSNVRYLMSIVRHSETKHVKTAMENLLIDLKDAEFNITLAYIDQFLPKLFKKLNEESAEIISSEIYRWIRDSSESLEKVLLSEAKTKKFYALPASRYNSFYLMESPESFLSAGAFLKLSEMAKFDFTSACRCLLYGEATASAFHILRATEEVLRLYYYKHIKSKRLKERDQVWGSMTSALERKKVRKPSKTILESLDLIRSSYRNPTQHPRIKYDINQAQDLFGLCVDIINKLVLDL